MRGSRLKALLIIAGVALPGLVVDFFAARGDVSPPVTLAVLLGSGLVLGWMAPPRLWICAVAVGLALPVAHLLAHGLGYPDNVSPDTYGARLLMAPITVGAVLAGSWVGRQLAGGPRRSP